MLLGLLWPFQGGEVGYFWLAFPLTMGGGGGSRLRVAKIVRFSFLLGLNLGFSFWDLFVFFYFCFWAP